jgi:hypothetical protein
VAVRVPGAGGDDGDGWPDRLEEGLARRGARAVVRDLEEIDRRQAAAEELGIHALLDVAREQEPLTTDLAEKDDRDVVDRGARVGRSFRDATRIGPHDAQLDRVESKSVARRQPEVRHVAARERIGPCPVARPRPEHPRLVHATHAIPPQEEAEPRDVVLVRVGEDEDVDAAVPRREPFVEGDQQPTRIRPAVDQHPAATPALDEDAVALPDVEDDDPGDPVGAMGEDHREPDGRRCERRNHQPGASATSAGGASHLRFRHGAIRDRSRTWPAQLA